MESNTEENVEWKFYTKEKSAKNVPKNLNRVIKIFNDKYKIISSDKNKLRSNEVLDKLKDELKKEKYDVEEPKKSIYILEDEKYQKLFRVDAFNKRTKTVLEVEAGRAYNNNQFLKDFFEACISPKTRYLIIAVKKEYKFGDGKYQTKDFEKIKKYFDALYDSNFKNSIPLDGLLIIGY